MTAAAATGSSNSSSAAEDLQIATTGIPSAAVRAGTVSPTATRDRFPRVAVPLVLFGALALRLYHLGARSLWTDEGSTWTAATSTVPALIQRCIERDASPPLFYLLTQLALELGDCEAWLRSVSLVASMGLVWLTYRLSRLFAGRGEAVLATLLVAVSPFQLMYAQEARTYTLVACLSVGALYFFARAVLRDEPRAWGPYLLFSVLAVYTQSIALLGVGVQAAIMLFEPVARARLREWLIAQLGVLGLFAPWLVMSLVQATHLEDSHWYLSTPDGHGVFQVLRAVFLTPLSLVTPPAGALYHGLDAWLPRPLAHVLLLLITGAPLAFGLAELRAPGPRGRILRLAAATLLLPLLAVLVVSVAVPLWLPRYFVLLTPPLAVLLAHGLHRMPRPTAWGLGALLIAVQLYACVRYDLDYTKEPWREVAAKITAASPAGRTAVLVPFDVDPYAYYNRGTRDRITAIEVSHPAVPFASRFTPRQLDELEGAARAGVAPFDEVWVVVRSPNSEVRREVARRAHRVASEGRAAVGGEETWSSTGGPLRVSHYRRP